MFNLDHYQQYLQTELRRSPLTVRAYMDDLTAFTTYLKDTPVESISLSDLRSYVMSMVERGGSPRSINRRICAIRNFYDYLIRQGVVDKNPATDIHALRTEKLLPHFILQAKIGRMIQNAEPSEDYAVARDQMIIQTLYFTGMRREELSSLNLENLDLAQRLFKFTGKGVKERIVPISDEFMAKLTHYLKVREKICNSEQKALFLNRKQERINSADVYRVVTRCLKLAGVDGRCSPHVLRHTFATHLTAAGVGIRTVQELLGHSSIASTQIYAHNTIETLKKSYNSAHPRAKTTTNMKTQIQSLHFTADAKLLAFIEAKFEKIEKFDDTIVSGDAILKLDKDNEMGNKVVVVKILSKGAEMIAERRAKSFEIAADDCFEALKKQIEKRRG